jgi:hypothetical protein
MNASRSPTDDALRGIHAPRREYLSRRRTARLASLGSALIAGQLIYLVIRLNQEGTNRFALIPWLVLVVHLAFSAVVLRWLWLRSKKARPEPLVDPDEPPPARRQHQAFSGELEPPKRW